MATLSPEEKLRNKFRQDPAFFHREVLGYEPWEKQLEISLSIRDNRNTAVRSNNGSGKTYHAAREALRFLYAYGPDAVVINTAPTWTQVENQFWRYFRDAYQKALVPLGGKLLKTKLELDETWFAIGIANDEHNMEGFQGWHAKKMLVIFDEASGISAPIHQAALGAMAGGEVVRFLMLGNPTLNSGPFCDAFKDPTFNKIHISAFDTPNVQAKAQIVPGLVTWEFVEEVRRKYGEDSDIYRIRVLGEFPQKASNTLISIDAVESAFNADREFINQDDDTAGLDVARYGDDDSALVRRTGNKAKVEWVVNGNNTMELAGKAALYLRDNPKLRLYIDIIGVGAGVFDRLREQPDIASRVYGVNVAGKARDDSEYINIRVESWANVRDWLRDAVLEKHEGFYELAQPKYKINSNGKLQLESKDDMKKRGVPSPNCFVAGTMVATPHGVIPIEYAVAGTVVSTPMGPRRVIKQWINETDRIATATFTNGRSLTGTPNHNIFTWDKGFVRLDALVLSNTIEYIDNLYLWKLRNILFTRDRNTGFSTRVDTLTVGGKINPSDFYTGIFGFKQTVLYQKITTSIIKMATGLIVDLRTLSVFLGKLTNSNTWLNDTKTQITLKLTMSTWPKRKRLQKSGTPPQQGLLGTASTQSEAGKAESHQRPFVQSVKVITLPTSPPARAFVPAHVNNETGTAADLLKRLVRFVRQSFPITNTGTQPAALSSVQVYGVEPTLVYNLTLEADNVYYANGILVKNCGDALALTLSRPTEGENLGLTWI